MCQKLIEVGLMTRLLDDWCVPDLEDEPDIAVQWKVGLNSRRFSLPASRPQPCLKLPVPLVVRRAAAGRAQKAQLVDT